MPRRDRALPGDVVVRGPRRSGTQDIEEGDARWSAARMLVVSMPSVCGYQCQHESSTLVEKIPVHSRVPVAYLRRHPREVVLDRSLRTVFEVDEQRTSCGVEHVPRVRFAMQELF